MSDYETSDDDYIDPSMDKYFKNDKKKSNEKKTKIEEDLGKSDESDLNDEEEEEDDDDSNHESESKNITETNEDDDEEMPDDGRKVLTMKMIQNWTEKLGVKMIYFILFYPKIKH
jgi:hypothetical protein